VATDTITKLSPIEGGLTLLGDPKRMLAQAQQVAKCSWTSSRSRNSR